MSNDPQRTPPPARTPADAVTCTGCNRIMWKDDVDADGRCGDCLIGSFVAVGDSHAQIFDAPTDKAAPSRKARP